MKILFIASALLNAAIVFAQPANPEYPRVNLSTGYTVDPNWPNTPEDIEWAAVPGVAVDAEDNVWLFTRKGPSVQVYSKDGAYQFGWGDTAGSHHIKIDRDGYIWTSDVRRHIVQKHKRDGTVLMTLGTPDEAGVDETHFFKPTDMAFASNGDIFVSDGYGNARVVHFRADGTYVKAWGSLGTGKSHFSIPHAIAIDSKDRIYVADRNNVRVQIYNTDGKLIDSWSNILVPWGFHITADDEIWICGSSPMHWENHPDYPGAPLGCPPKDQLLMRLDTNGRIQEMWTFPKAADGEESPGELNWVHCIALDSDGNVYLGDIIGKRLQKFVPSK